MRLKRRIQHATVAALLVSAAILGITTTPAQSANLLCPKTCLTGGVLGLGGARTSIQSTETRYYEFEWTAIDLTEIPPLTVTLEIDMDATGTVSNGVFTGTDGMAYIYQSEYSGQYLDEITIRDTGLIIQATAKGYQKSFNLVATVLGGGVAEFQSQNDYSWTEYSD